MTLDIASLITDPDFARPFSLTRSDRAVDTHGRAVLTEVDIPVTGVILPATDKQLQRLPEGDRSMETIAVYARIKITPGSKSNAPDRVTWRGEIYEVKQVQDWMDTAGFCVALAASTSRQGREVDS